MFVDTTVLAQDADAGAKREPAPPMFYHAEVLRQFIFLSTLLPTPALPSDWPGAGGDPQRARWQKEEELLTPASVKGLKLLWKCDTLTAPLIVGPIVTHRGVKELVFIAGSSGTFHAVDVDLGRLLWQRHLERDAAPFTRAGLCNGALTASRELPRSELDGQHARHQHQRRVGRLQPGEEIAEIVGKR